MQKETQKNNVISIQTPAGKDTLYLTHFTANEGISDLFTISANMFTVDTQIAHEDLVGKPVTISLRNANGKGHRYFNGVVSHLTSLGSRISDSTNKKNYIDYRATIVPTASSMRFRQNCRIFQNVTIIDIVSDLFGQHGVTFQNKAKKSYPKYDYCVQYQESDYDFVCRLFQQEGIFFFFEHTQGDHKLVFADDTTVYKDCVEASVAQTTGSFAESHVDSWQGGLSLAPGGYASTGFDFEKPKKHPEGEQKKSELPTQDIQEIFEYHGESEINKRASGNASVQLEAMQRNMHANSGTSDCRSFSVGKLFTFKEHDDPRLVGKTFVITEMTTHASSPNQSGAAQSSTSEPPYINQFSCVPKEVPYRPQKAITKPLIYGIQTALVTGDPGDEQYIDNYGRVKVKFDWDRDGKPDSTSSCWIRVAQSWAGNKWGAFFFPRVGQEVLIEFVNGDPDQPIISGALYNADLMPPYDLPANKTQSGIKSHSTKEGSTDNFNEIRFEDAKGKELLYLQAEKDHHLHVKNDQRDEVLNDRIAEVTKNDTLKVGETLKVEAGKEIIIQTGSASIKMQKDGTIQISGKKITIEGASGINQKAPKINLN
ncbi:type VI secretion system tip protein TssI/VgrG [Algicola sagamiensis]|uniref:type VI secretion system tip protein TssI/VgrG n=1 Tax=Algicola sagamiensis TaxID=163869 RepID=UPI00035FAB3E|nr:type VI secretion system tip protein TssI/VgrG [Algicola sagamiensis]